MWIFSSKNVDLSFYTKHMFKFIYVNQVIHMVILVDNVDNFVYNLIISGFADFCHVENFLESFSLIHHSSTGFVHIARTTFSGLILPVSARTCLTLPILSDVYIKPFFLQLFMVFLLRAVLTSALFFVNVKTLKQRVDFSVPDFFRSWVSGAQLWLLASARCSPLRSIWSFIS